MEGSQKYLALFLLNINNFISDKINLKYEALNLYYRLIINTGDKQSWCLRTLCTIGVLLKYFIEYYYVYSFI